MMKNYLLKKEFFISNQMSDIKESYDVIKEIGKGAYGTVYLAKHRIFPYSQRVIKRISKRKVKNPTSVINQFRATGKLDHPRIIKMYETFEDNNSLFLVLDYCEGGELFTRLSNSNAFTEEQAKIIFRDMVNSIKYMHGQKIAHRDLKLENFLMENNDSWNVTLIDFGLAYEWKHNMAQKVVGTTYYIAPEVFKHIYDQRCDIWSLGVILYMMVTGTPPFDGNKDSEIIVNIIKLKYSLKTDECKVLSPALLDLIHRILQPVDRRATIAQILAHPWLSQPTHIVTIPLKLQFQKIINFTRFSKLKKIVATYISAHLSQGQIDQLRQIFQSIDSNQDGYLSIDQFHSFILQKEGETISKADIEKLMQNIDTDRNGKINYNEFLSSCIDQSIITNLEYLRFVFNSFDLNRDGKIQREEFNTILKSYTKEFRCNIELVQALMQENDKNKDGNIDFHEFQASMLMIRKKEETNSSLISHIEEMKDE